MVRTLQDALRPVDAAHFVAALIPKGWIPKNNSTKHNDNVICTLDADVVIVGSNGEDVRLDDGTEIVIYRVPDRRSSDIMASCFTMPANNRKTVVNIMTDGAIVFRSCYKARPASRTSSRRVPSLA